MTIPKLATPYSTSEFRQLVEDIRVHQWGMAGQIHEVAAELRYNLRNHLRSAGVGRADALVIVRAVTRPMIRGARLEYDVARCALRSYQVYMDRVVNRGNAAKTHGRSFDPNK